MENTDFTIRYNGGKGEMTLHLEKFFERKPNGRFVRTIKPNIYKIFKLVYANCTDDAVKFLLDWLENHSCADLATYYKSKYGDPNDEAIPLF